MGSLQKVGFLFLALPYARRVCIYRNKDITNHITRLVGIQRYFRVKVYNRIF